MGRWTVTLLAIGAMSVGCSSRPSPSTRAVGRLGSTVASATSRSDLARTVSVMEARIKKDNGDITAVVLLAEALLRQARFSGNLALPMRAEVVLQEALARNPGAYEVQQLLGAVYLSQHRFEEARVIARKCIEEHPHDAWAYGVLGDAELELGNRDAAFDAFNRMVELKPNSASYSRISYARELSGDVDGAIRMMTMALNATSAHDAEGIAWLRSQLANLYLKQDRLDDARRELAHALFVFDGYPPALEGLARMAPPTK